MKVDLFRHHGRVSYGLILPHGNRIEDLAGEGAEIASQHGPWQLSKTDVSLDLIARGELYDQMKTQIERIGVGLMKSVVKVGTTS
jgi:hypothetical protein